MTDLTCPYCHRKHNDHLDTSMENMRPQHGDVSICIQCGGLGMFDMINERVRQVTRDEQARIEQECPEIAHVMNIWKKVVHGKAKQH